MSDCPICKGEGWVCEEHRQAAWGNGKGCCEAAGAPCECNPSGSPPSDMTIIWDRERGYLS